MRFLRGHDKMSPLALGWKAHSSRDDTPGEANTISSATIAAS